LPWLLNIEKRMADLLYFYFVAKCVYISKTVGETSKVIIQGL